MTEAIKTQSNSQPLEVSEVQLQEREERSTVLTRSGIRACRIQQQVRVKRWIGWAANWKDDSDEDFDAFEEREGEIRRNGDIMIEKEERRMIEVSGVYEIPEKPANTREEAVREMERKTEQARQEMERLKGDRKETKPKQPFAFRTSEPMIQERKTDPAEQARKMEPGAQEKKAEPKFTLRFKTPEPKIQAKKTEPEAQARKEVLGDEGWIVEPATRPEIQQLEIYMHFGTQTCMERVEEGTTEAQLVIIARRCFSLGPVRLVVHEKTDRIEAHEKAEYWFETKPQSYWDKIDRMAYWQTNT
jgi:hypothetical protein